MGCLLDNKPDQDKNSTKQRAQPPSLLGYRFVSRRLDALLVPPSPLHHVAQQQKYGWGWDLQSGRVQLRREIGSFAAASTYY